MVHFITMALGGEGYLNFMGNEVRRSMLPAHTLRFTAMITFLKKSTKEDSHYLFNLDSHLSSKELYLFVEISLINFFLLKFD